jgi:hypothetical protein
MPLSVPSVP